MYTFLRTTDFIGQSATYFKQKNLHAISNIHTIGQIIYTSDQIVLRSLNDDKEVTVGYLETTMPEDGTYVHVYGNLSFLKDVKNISWLNFDVDEDTRGSVSLIMNITCWKDLQHVRIAKRLEELTYRLNYEV